MAAPDRRAFLAVCAASGLTSTLLPGVLWAQIQPGTRTLTLEMVRHAAQLAGLTWTDAESQELIDSLSSLARGAEDIDKPSLTNASPLPLHFDPVPPGLPLPPAPPAVFRVRPAPEVTRPANLETAAFWPVTHLARLLRDAAGDIAGADDDVPGAAEAPQRRPQLRGRADRGAGARRGDGG